MDYIFASAVKGYPFPRLILTYDVVCQYYVNLWQRMENWPEHLRINPLVKIVPAIPDLHMGGHPEKGHSVLSLRNITRIGKIEGEGVERNWHDENAAAPSTSRMGPGTRHDVLDDNFGSSNHRRRKNMGKHHSLSHFHLST